MIPGAFSFNKYSFIGAAAKGKSMKKTIILIVLFTFSFIFTGCGDNDIDINLNGIWTGKEDVEHVDIEFIKGASIIYFNDAKILRSTYKTVEGKITMTITDIHGNALNAIVVSLLLNEEIEGLSTIPVFENKWYPVESVLKDYGPLLKAGIGDDIILEIIKPQTAYYFRKSTELTIVVTNEEENQYFFFNRKI